MYQGLVVVILSLIVNSTCTYASGRKQSIKEITSKNIVVSPTLSNTTSRVKSSINRHTIGLGLGQTILLGGFEDNADDGIAIPDLFYSYSASHSFDLMINLHYSDHKFNNTEVKLTGIAVHIKGRLYNFDSFSPFIVGGFGIYRPVIKSYVDDELIKSDPKATFGTGIGFGADLILNNHVSIGILAQYHNPFDIRQEIGPKVEGSYTKLLITSNYTF